MNTNQLRPGRHQLSRDEVSTHQRERIFGALETVMAEQGYLDTSVADLIRGAGVSRQTFYELFSSKEDCFVASYGRRRSALIEAVTQLPAGESPMDRFATLLRGYLVVMARDPGLAQLYLVGVWAAGPAAIAKRLQLQQQFVEAIATIFVVRPEDHRFTCQALVATISTLVTNALLEPNPAQAVLALHQPLVDVARRLMADG